MLRILRNYDVKTLVVAPLLVPLLAYIFFSVGTMPTFSKQGFEIVICSGTGPLTTSPEDNKDEPTHSQCEWSSQIVEANAEQHFSSESAYFGSFYIHKYSARYDWFTENRHYSKKARAPPLPL